MYIVNDSACRRAKAEAAWFQTFGPRPRRSYLKQDSLKPMRLPKLQILWFAFFLPMTTMLAPQASDVSEVEWNAKPKTVPTRNFHTFLPKPGDKIDDASAQLVQVLLDRQTKGEFDSYMVQILFRGKVPERTVKSGSDKIVIEFLDTGKPSMRLAKIRGGIVEASALEELFYREPVEASKAVGKVKHMIRMTIFLKGKAVDLKFRDTLDRTLIHFTFPNNPSK